MLPVSLKCLQADSKITWTSTRHQIHLNSNVICYNPGAKINNYSPKWRWITDTEVNNCFSIYHTRWITSGPKSNFICENIATKAILFSFGCSEVNSTWLITSKLANQRVRKVLFTCVVYTNLGYSQEYFQPKIRRKIWLFSLGLENNILIKNESSSSPDVYWLKLLLIAMKH